jgi:hypothetical protein
LMPGERIDSTLGSRPEGSMCPASGMATMTEVLVDDDRDPAPSGQPSR